MILFVFGLARRLSSGVTVSDLSFSYNDAFGLMNLLGGGTLQSFSILPMGKSLYYRADYVQLLSMDVLPA